MTQLVQLSRLPSWVEEIEEAYVSLPRSLECLASMCQGAELMELGQKAAARLSLATLSPPFLQALMQAPSGLHRIDILTWACALEYSDLRIQLVPEGSQLRIQCNCPGLRGNPFFALTEWPILAMVIATLRSALGDQWAPSEVTLRSRGKPCTAATTAFGAPRILTEQPHCSLVVDGAALQACAAPRPVSLPLQPGPVAQPLRFRGWAFVPAFRELVRPYLADGYPELPQMAALMGISTRTLQRRLQASGQSYSALVQDLRLEVARDLLRDPGVRVLDVAHEAGYESPQHFSRAFRRQTGMSPSRFRQTALRGTMPNARRVPG